MATCLIASKRKEKKIISSYRNLKKKITEIRERAPSMKISQMLRGTFTLFFVGFVRTSILTVYIFNQINGNDSFYNCAGEYENGLIYIFSFKS